MKRFEYLQSSMVSPFAMHQQQLAMLAQQQSLLMAAAAKSAGMDQKFPGIIQQPVSNGSNLPSQSWPNVGYQIPGLMMPVDGQAELQKVTQVGSVRLNYVMLFHLFASIEFLILLCFFFGSESDTDHGTSTSTGELCSIFNI